jgi:hypothetical protein
MLISVASQYETTERRGATQHLVHLKEPRRPMPKQEVLDALADFALDGGYNTRRGNVCPNCYVAKSVNGTCGCLGD